jgi:hypothetical protein
VTEARRRSVAPGEWRGGELLPDDMAGDTEEGSELNLQCNCWLMSCGGCMLSRVSSWVEYAFRKAGRAGCLVCMRCAQTGSFSGCYRQCSTSAGSGVDGVIRELVARGKGDGCNVVWYKASSTDEARV